MACGLLFSKDAIKLYLEWKTVFQITHEKLTLEDLPVVTICFEGLDIVEVANFSINHCDQIEKLDWIVNHTWAIGNGEHNFHEMR